MKVLQDHKRTTEAVANQCNTSLDSTRQSFSAHIANELSPLCTMLHPSNSAFESEASSFTPCIHLPTKNKKSSATTTSTQQPTLKCSYGHDTLMLGVPSCPSQQYLTPPPAPLHCDDHFRLIVTKYLNHVMTAMLLPNLDTLNLSRPITQPNLTHSSPLHLRNVIEHHSTTTTNPLKMMTLFLTNVSQNSERRNNALIQEAIGK